MEFKKLFIPGPTQVHPDVLAKMATPMIGHRSADASELQRNISTKLQKLMYTQNNIVLSTSSGTGLMEGAIRGSTLKKAIVFSVGSFGKRWWELANLNGVGGWCHRSGMRMVMRVGHNWNRCDWPSSRRFWGGQLVVEKSRDLFF